MMTHNPSQNLLTVSMHEDGIFPVSDATQSVSISDETDWTMMATILVPTLGVTEAVETMVALPKPEQSKSPCGVVEPLWSVHYKGFVFQCQGPNDTKIGDW